MTISEVCVRRPVFATMLVLALVVLGIFSFHDLGVDLLPKADPATVNVTVQLPGASPDEITTAVIMPIEDSLSSIAGIDQLQAGASEGSARITIRFVLDRDLNESANSVREKVAAAMRNLPPQVLPPIVQAADPDADPIMTLVLYSDAMSLRTITEIADKQVRRGIESADGVGEVTLSGGRAREIHVVMDVAKLNSYGLTVDQVRSAIQSENVEVPGGTIEQGKAQVELRTLGRIDATDQFKNIIITTVNATPIRISDIGFVEDSTERAQSSLFMDSRQPAVQLDIRKASGENTIKVTDAVKAKLASIQRGLPKEMHLDVVRDDSRFINASVASLEEHLIWGSLLAALVVTFFIRNVRAVIISALAIPASIIATFTLMRGMGFTLNSMTLLGITLAVGIVIDDAIVVMENIFRYLEEKDCSPFEAAIQGTREVTLAVMATTLSLIVIFLPIAFMTGYAKRFIYPFGWTMAFSILVSMLVSFTLTPMLSSRLLKRTDAINDEKTKDSRFFRAVDRWYTTSLKWSLAHPMVVIGVSLFAFLLTFPLNRMVGRSFIPAEDMGEFTIHADTPEGTSLEGTTEAAKRFASEISGVEGIGHIEYLAGASKVTHLHLFVFLKPPSERTETQDQIVTAIRKILSAHPGNSPIVAVRSPLGGGESGTFPIQANLMGPDIGRLSDYALQLLDKAQHTPSLQDPKTGVSISSPEIRVAVDRGRAADLGVRMSTVGNTLRLMVSGDDEISTYREGAEQYPVKMRVLEEQRRDIETISRLTVGSTTSGPVRIDNIAHLERGFGPSQIQRLNRQFSINMSADVTPGYALDAASNDVRRLIAGLKMPPGYIGQMAGQTQILDQTTANLLMAIGLASIFVYMVLAAQFESFVQPIVIMLVLPLSIPFALLTLWMTGRTLNLWSALGTLLLFGIVKKNAILQVDYANILRARGVPAYEAIVDACRTRMRPILMTTSAIIAGLVPTALGLGIGGAQRSAIAVTIIGGQTMCLFLTLLLVPVAYSKVVQFEESPVGMRAREFARKLAAATLGRWRQTPEPQAVK
jgi:hydrophobe/amphiphile efflux-1 (HAE1) family protein